LILQEAEKHGVDGRACEGDDDAAPMPYPEMFSLVDGNGTAGRRPAWASRIAGSGRTSSSQVGVFRPLCGDDQL
jgi:hypothetical protein